LNSISREKFESQGFFLFKQLLDKELISRLTDFSEEILSQQDLEHFEQQKATGSMVLIDWEMAYRYRVIAELIAHPKILNAFLELGFTEPKFGHGRIISKPRHSPPLFWHEDGRFWNDPVSYTPQPIQSFLMIYLTDTTPENGCLRVIPGSHLKRHYLHDQVPEGHQEELRTYATPEAIGFQTADGEIDVPVKAGDVVMGYASTFHAAHANQSDASRTVLTMWYYPDFVNLPERSQATVALLEKKAGTVKERNEQVRALLNPLRIVYNGDAEPIPTEWTPGSNLK